MSTIKHVTLQKIIAHDFQYDPRISATYVAIFRETQTIILFLLATDQNH